MPQGKSDANDVVLIFIIDVLLEISAHGARDPDQLFSWTRRFLLKRGNFITSLSAPGLRYLQ